MKRQSLLNNLPVYKGKQKVLLQDQSTKNIIDEIIKAHYLYAADYKKISKNFEGANDLQTGKNVFNFLKENVRYIVDSEENQKIKSPAAIIATGACDCKCYSLFIGGILGAMKIPFVYRFASYNKNKNLGHVFVVMYYYGKEIFIDPVIEKFNDKKPYTYKVDKMITSISGIGKKAPSKQVVKSKAPLKKVLVKVAAVPARNAFLLLVKLNFKNLAVKLANAFVKNPAGVAKIWAAVGGKIDSLKNAVSAGSKKKQVENLAETQAIGVITAGAAIAAAAPIILKVTTFLKSIGIDGAKIKQVAAKELVKKVNKVKKEIEAKKEQKQEQQAPIQDVNNVNLAENTQLTEAPAATDQPFEFDESKSITMDTVTVTAPKKNNTLLYAAAAVAAIFLITKK